MATLTPAQQQAADAMMAGTFSNPAMQTSGWGKPVGASPPYLRQGASGVSFDPSVGFVPGAIPTDRLPQGSAGLPNPSPGSGLTPQQLAMLGGWSTDPRTGQFSYSAPGATNPAVGAAAGVAAGVPLPRPRPGIAPTSIDMAAIAAQQGANPGMGGAMIGSGQMAPGIAPQGPPPAGITPTVWKGDGSTAMGAPVGTQQPVRTLSPSQAYDAANIAAQIAAQQRGAAGRAAGMLTPVDQMRAQGYSPQDAYLVADAMGGIKAQQRGIAGRAAGQTTAVDKLRAQGMSASGAYDALASQARKGTGENGGNPDWW